MKPEEIRKAVRTGYARIARNEAVGCCGPQSICGCKGNTAMKMSKNMGYSEAEMQAVPEEANLGLGCGNPVALASLTIGETVIDLGSGAGFDCFLAAEKVGRNGKVIGVDMTPDMIEKARENARMNNYQNVEFRLGEIENLPVADNLADVLISNCVINLSADKRRVFKEAFRVLKPGGRFMISDIVLLSELPDFIRNSIEAYVGCLSGALLKDEYLQLIEEAGFEAIEIVEENTFPIDLMLNDPTAQALIKKYHLTPEKIAEIDNSVRSIRVKGMKPIAI